MNKKSVYAGLAIFSFLMCFAFDFNASEVIWIWKDKIVVPVILGITSLISIILYFRISKEIVTE